MCEVEISDSNVEIVDSDHNHFTTDHMNVVPYEHYEHEVSVGGSSEAEDQYEEVTCETEDSQNLLMQSMDDDGKFFF
jgi:hypothetical protein